MEAAMKKVVFLFAIIAFLGTVTFAQTQTAQVNKTQKRQAERIKQGAKSGELTKKETKVLVNEQKNIQKEKKMAKADGIVTPAEKKVIKKDQAKASKDIAKLKHNKKVRK
jgi:DNA-binding transcriptional regulator of glucitol operon